MGLSWDLGLGRRAGRGPSDAGPARPRRSIGHVCAEKAPRPRGARSVTGPEGTLAALGLRSARDAGGGVGPGGASGPRGISLSRSPPSPSPRSGEAACPAEGRGARGRAGAP